MHWVGGVSSSDSRKEQLLGVTCSNSILVVHTGISQSSGTGQVLNFYDISGNHMSLKGSLSEFLVKGKEPRTAKLITSNSLNEQAVLQENGEYVLGKFRGICFLENVLCVGAGKRGIILITLQEIPEIYQYQEIKKGTPARVVPIDGYVEKITKIGGDKLLVLIRNDYQSYFKLMGLVGGNLQEISRSDSVALSQTQSLFFSS